MHSADAAGCEDFDLSGASERERSCYRGRPIELPRDRYAEFTGGDLPDPLSTEKPLEVFTLEAQ
jgi:hypothetical protein